MKLSGGKAVVGGFLLAAVLFVPAWGTSDTHSALPGTLNYVEGQASIGNEALNAKSIGAVNLEGGQTIATQNGKAEVLLTPGVFLRLGDDSSAQMVSPDLDNTQIALKHGEAMVEVDEIHPENDIRISENGTSTRLLKTGLYDFDAAHNVVRTFDGKAQVLDGDRRITVKGGHELALQATGKPKSREFDKKEYAQNSELYRWSSLRSDYLADANVSAAQVFVDDGGWGPGWWGPGWFGAGWYWSPWWDCYTFLPGDGFLYSPFGWGFYSPFAVYDTPYVAHGPVYHHFSNFHPDTVSRGAVGRAPVYGPGFHGGAVRSFGGAFEGKHSAPPMRSGGGFGARGGFGGFHSGAIGFHGGGFGGHR